VGSALEKKVSESAGLAKKVPANKEN